VRVARKSRGEKFPLLIYRRWAKMLRLPGLLIAVSAGVVWWFAPDYPLLADNQWALIALGVIGALIFFYSLYARQAAYVQCLPRYVKIRTPFMSVAVSYRRIRQVRPVEFHTQLPLSDLKSTQRRLLQPFLPQTIILLELNRFPTSERRLRTWVPWFMFAADVRGFLLVVDSWMDLSRQISVFADRWITDRQARHRPAAGRMF
jgi:hypothetical protein